MTQINLHVTLAFESDLAKLMKDRSLRSKSEAIRLAVHEAASRIEQTPKPIDWSELIGLVDRYPGGRQDPRSGAELLAEIDREMDEKLDRLARRR